MREFSNIVEYLSVITWSKEALQQEDARELEEVSGKETKGKNYSIRGAQTATLPCIAGKLLLNMGRQVLGALFTELTAGILGLPGNLGK